MLDQLFSGENFRSIFDTENRKGLDVASLYFPALNHFTLERKQTLNAISELSAKKKSMQKEEYIAKKTKLKSVLSTIKENKSKAIDKELDELSRRVLKPDFRLVLSQKTGPNNKPVFCVDNSAAAFFVIKQLQRNIHRIYNVKQSNRHHLACQLRDTLSCTHTKCFPFELVRTDISTFYESIDRNKLIAKLESDQILSSTSLNFLKHLMTSYQALTGNPIGIPRGVGISAYLAELCLHDLDQEIRLIPGLVLYCRYVDDIVTVFARPSTGLALHAYKDQLSRVLHVNGFTCNPIKTQEVLIPSQTPQTFEYLGYSFNISPYGLAISPSQAKLDKLKTRLDAAFNCYHISSHTNSRKAYRALTSRIKYLTGNTKLANSKSHVAVGLYYSNSLMTDCSGLQTLDKYLSQQIKLLKSKRLRLRLKYYTFTLGFSERRFHRYDPHDFHMISKAWKHA